MLLTFTLSLEIYSKNKSIQTVISYAQRMIACATQDTLAHHLVSVGVALVPSLPMETCIVTQVETFIIFSSNYKISYFIFLFLLKSVTVSVHHYNPIHSHHNKHITQRNASLYLANNSLTINLSMSAAPLKVENKGVHTKRVHSVHRHHNNNKKVYLLISHPNLVVVGRHL